MQLFSAISYKLFANSKNKIPKALHRCNYFLQLAINFFKSQKQNSKSSSQMQLFSAISYKLFRISKKKIPKALHRCNYFLQLAINFFESPKTKFRKLFTDAIIFCN